MIDRLLHAIADRAKVQPWPPTVRELAVDLDLALGATHRWITVATQRRLVDHLDHQPRTLVLTPLGWDHIARVHPMWEAGYLAGAHDALDLDRSRT